MYFKIKFVVDKKIVFWVKNFEKGVLLIYIINVLIDWVFVFFGLIDVNIVEVYFIWYDIYLFLVGLGRICCNMVISESIISICREGTIEVLLDKVFRIVILILRIVFFILLRAL